ncbi:hypothetical protein K474DRAFT_1672836 [Panus rudis PR-1116 ss-1]|nr:hypothetical protein K474DRAFT_1672836 [Panus rudis PR-1116 ss-1]
MADLLDSLSEARRHLLFEFQALIGVFIRELGTLSSDPGCDRLPAVQPLIQSVYHNLMLQSEPYGMRSYHDALLFCLHEVSTTFICEIDGLSISSGSLAEVHRVAMPDLGRVESQLCHLKASLISCHRMLASLKDMLVRKERTLHIGWGSGSEATRAAVKGLVEESGEGTESCWGVN